MVKKQTFAKALAGLVITIIFFLTLEGLSAILAKTVLKTKLDAIDLRTKFETAYIQPFAPKRQDALRVFVYGGSTVQGLPLPKLGMVNQLDYQLHQVFGETKNIEVYNLGWSGYNSTMVRYMVGETIDSRPDLIVVYTGENEFIYPQLDFYEAMKTLTVAKNRSNFIRLLLSLKTADSASKDEKIDQTRPAFRTQSLFYPLKMMIYQHNLKAIVNLAKSYNIPVVLTTPVANIRDWPPIARKVTNLKKDANYDLLLEKIKESIDKNDFQTASLNLTEALKKYPNDAPFLYLQARADKALAQPLSSYYYIRAKDWDLIPWRASTQQIEFLKSLEDGKNVWVADAEKAFFANSPENLTGFELVIDNVHPTSEGNYLLAKTIVELIKKEKIVKKDWPTPFPLLTLDDILAKAKYSSDDEFNLLFSTSKYCLKNPFFNISAAQDYLQKAEKIYNGGWQTTAMQASIAFVKGEDATASALFAKAESLNGAKLTAEDLSQIPYLSQIAK